MSKHTPGPWRWEYSAQSKQVHLCGGRPRYDLRVMDFVRFGMNNAAPRFVERPAPGHEILERCDKFAVPVAGREHHASWFQDIAHPDARLIAAAPDLLEALEALVALCHEQERLITEQLFHVDFCGESLPLTNARAAIAKAK